MRLILLALASHCAAQPSSVPAASVPAASVFKMALCQLAVGDNKTENLRGAEAAIREAAGNGAQLVVLPECFNSPYAVSKFAEYAEGVPASRSAVNLAGHPSTHMLCSVAEALGVYIVGGSIPERDAQTGKLYNTAIAVGPDGAILARHRKLHLFDIHIPGKIAFRESETLSSPRCPSSIRRGAASGWASATTYASRSTPRCCARPARTCSSIRARSTRSCATPALDLPTSGSSPILCHAPVACTAPAHPCARRIETARPADRADALGAARAGARRGHPVLCGDRVTRALVRPEVLSGMGPLDGHLSVGRRARHDRGGGRHRLRGGRRRADGGAARVDPGLCAASARPVSAEVAARRGRPACGGARAAAEGQGLAAVAPRSRALSLADGRPLLGSNQGRTSRCGK